MRLKEIEEMLREFSTKNDILSRIETGFVRKKGGEMKKKAFFALQNVGSIGLALCVLATTSYAKFSTGIRLPFQMSNTITAKTDTKQKSSTEMWVGGLGTFEYGFSPVFGVELGAGYLMSLGGKTTNEYDSVKDEWEYKNEVIPISMLMKVYLPLGKKDNSRVSIYFAGGPQVALVTRSAKVNDDYEKAYSLTGIGLGGFMGQPSLIPTLKIGIDYSISKAMKLGGLMEVGFSSDSYNPEEGKEESDTYMGFGLGVGFKYCFSTN